jgi:hypothetical protein
MTVKKTATRKKKTVNDTPLFDEAGYNRIIKAIDEQLAKLHALQTEILVARATQRGEFEAMNKRRETEDRRLLRSIKTPKLPVPKKLRRTKKDKPA